MRHLIDIATGAVQSHTLRRLHCCLSLAGRRHRCPSIVDSWTSLYSATQTPRVLRCASPATARGAASDLLWLAPATPGLWARTADPCDRDLQSRPLPPSAARLRA